MPSILLLPNTGPACPILVPIYFLFCIFFIVDYIFCALKGVISIGRWV